MSKEEYRREQLRKRSTTGESGKRYVSYVKMTRRNYIKRLKLIIGTTALSVLMTLGAGKALIDAYQDSTTIASLSSEFRREVITPNTHLTSDHKHFYYDYEKMASYIESMDNFDEGVYLLDLNIGDYQTGLVLGQTDYKSFTKYKEVKGYETTEDFQDDMKRQVLLMEDINEKQQELEEMAREHSETINNEEERVGAK